MSARKIQSAAPARRSEQISLEARQTRLSLSPEAILIRKNGLEFRSLTPFALWTELTLNLDCPQEGCVNCTGVIVGCTGNRHAGYIVSVVFTAVSKQAQARLNALAFQ